MVDLDRLGRAFADGQARRIHEPKNAWPGAALDVVVMVTSKNGFVTQTGRNVGSTATWSRLLGFEEWKQGVTQA